MVAEEYIDKCPGLMLGVFLDYVSKPKHFRDLSHEPSHTDLREYDRKQQIARALFSYINLSQYPNFEDPNLRAELEEIIRGDISAALGIHVAECGKCLRLYHEILEIKAREYILNCGDMKLLRLLGCENDFSRGILGQIKKARDKNLLRLFD